MLGFLLAGPVGTVVGAAAGSGNSSIAADLVAITFVRGWVLVVRRVSSEDLAVLTRYRIGSEAHAAEQQRIATTVLEVPEQLPDRPHQKWSRSEEYEATDLEPARQAIEDTLPELKPIINKTFDEYAEFKWKYYGSEAYLPEEASLIAGLARSELLKVHLGELGARRRAALIKSLDKDLQDAVKRLGRDNSKIEDAEKTLKSFGIFSKSEQKTQLKETIRSLKNANGRKLAIIAVNQRHIEELESNIQLVNRYSSAHERERVARLLDEALASQSIQIKPPVEKALSAVAKIESDDERYFELYRLAIRTHNSIAAPETKTVKPEIVSINSASSGNNGSSQPVKERLQELKELRDQELISDEEFNTARAKILDSI